MDIVLSLPTHALGKEMHSIKNLFEVHGKYVRLTDQTGGTDWDVPFITYALSFLSIPLVTFSKALATEVGTELGKTIGKDAVKLYEEFKKGVYNLVNNRNRTIISQDPYIIFNILTETNNFEVIFELGLVKADDIQACFQKMGSSAFKFIETYKRNEQLINEKDIGILAYWNHGKKEWQVTSIQGKWSHARMYGIEI